MKHSEMRVVTARASEVRSWRREMRRTVMEPNQQGHPRKRLERERHQQRWGLWRRQGQ